MAPQKDWFNCNLCGRNTLGRHAYHMHVKPCKKVQKSAEVISSQPSWFAVIPQGFTEDVRIPATNEYVDAGDFHSSSVNHANIPSTSTQVLQILDTSDIWFLLRRNLIWLPSGCLCGIPEHEYWYALIQRIRNNTFNSHLKWRLMKNLICIWTLSMSQRSSWAQQPEKVWKNGWIEMVMGHGENKTGVQFSILSTRYVGGLPASWTDKTRVFWACHTVS